ncbi:MAG: hypothetical protein V5A14_05480 [Desulfohalobiaceae bacterium]
MEDKEKKVAAISAGLAYYLQEEQESLQMMQQKEAQARPEPRPAFPVNSPWSMAGRQAIMERRFLWQFRLAR